MFITILKNLVSKPATRRYPFKDIRKPVAGYRGKIIFDAETCKLCGACARLCPAKAIEVNRQTRVVKYYPFNCIYCGTCMEGCPSQSIVQDTHYAAAAFTKPTETFNVPAPEPSSSAPASG